MPALSSLFAHASSSLSPVDMFSSRRALTRFTGLLTQRRAIHPATKSSTVNDAEISHFSRLSSEWWDESGEFSFLHRMNPVRVQFIQEKLSEIARDDAPDDGAHIQPSSILKGLDVLDIGCGGGLLSEVRTGHPAFARSQLPTHVCHRAWPGLGPEPSGSMHPSPTLP